MRHYSRELITAEEFESCDDNSHSAVDSTAGAAAVSDVILSLVVYVSAQGNMSSHVLLKLFTLLKLSNYKVSEPDFLEMLAHHILWYNLPSSSRNSKIMHCGILFNALHVSQRCIFYWIWCLRYWLYNFYHQSDLKCSIANHAKLFINYGPNRLLRFEPQRFA